MNEDMLNRHPELQKGRNCQLCSKKPLTAYARRLQMKCRSRKLNVGQRSYYAGDIIWKRSFNSTVRPTVRVHTNPSRKRSSNRRNFKKPLFLFSCERKTFSKQWRHDNRVISLIEFTYNANPKWPVFVAFLNSSGVGWKGNILCVFRATPSFSYFSSVV